LGQRKSVLYNGLNRAVLNPKRPPPLGGVNESRFLGPTLLVMLSFMNGELIILVIVVDVGVGVV
jgi:hypothetical protein